MKKRLLSILLALCMALCLLPAGVMAEGEAEEAPVCICETACTAESMNAECPVCGAEGALAESCGKYAAPANAAEAEEPSPADSPAKYTAPENSGETAEGVSAQALSGTDITFPAPKAGEKVGDGMKTVSADADSGLTPYLFGPVLWKQDGDHQKLNAEDVYAEESTYLLQFTFYTQKPITAETAVTFNGQPVTLYTEYAEFEAAVSAYDGKQDANLGFVMFSEDGTGDPSMGDLKDIYILGLYAFVHIPKTPATADVSTAEELTAALADSSSDIVRLMKDITLSTDLTVSRTVTLDLNDRVLTITGEDSFITVSGKDTTLTLTDSAETKTQRKFSINRDGAWVPDENGDETVTGGVITGGRTSVDTNMGTPDVNSGVCIKNHGTLNVTDGTLNAPVEIDSRGTIAGSGIFNGTVINQDKLTGGTFYGPVVNHMGGAHAKNEISGGIFYGTVANGLNYNDAGYGEMASPRGSGLISGGTFYDKVTNAFYGEITGGSFYGKVDNRERTDFQLSYQGTLAGGTFYAGHPGTVADGCCTVTYEYPFEETYAIQIVQKGETAIRPTEPEMNGFTFCGWYMDETCTDESKYDFTAPVTGKFTLYAKWEGTYYGIRITDKNGEVFYVTDKNADDVLGDGTVSYTPGYIDAGKTFTNDDWNRTLRGETVEGLQLPKLTLNGADLQSILMTGIRGSDANTIFLSTTLQIELVGDNTITCDADGVDAIYARMLVITGRGSLNAAATGQNAAAIGVETEGGRYCQYGGDVTLYGAYGGICCSDAYFEFAAGKLTVSSPRSALYCDLNDLHFKVTSDTTTFFCGTSKEEAFEIQQPSIFENVANRLVEENCYFVPVPGRQTILYAQLTSNHTVTFDTDGGSAVDTQNVPYGGNATLPAAPTKSGCTFAGWYLGDETYDFTAAVTENLTLTAKWTVCDHAGSTAKPTCTDAAACTECGETLPALGHDWGAWTSDGNGAHTRVCKRDGTHTETESCSGGKATCKDKAVCEVCGASYGGLDPKNHTELKHVPARAATKKAEGNIEYWYCKDCNKYFSDKDGTKEIKKADTVTAKLKDSQKSPKTGDNSELTLWIALMSIGGIAAAGTLVISRKKKHNR